MKKYLLILVMLISMIGYVVGLYGFFHNLNFMFREITISPWMIAQGLFPLLWGILAVLTFAMAEYMYRKSCRNEVYFQVQSFTMGKKSILFWDCWCINCTSGSDDIHCCKSIRGKCK